MKRLEEEIRKAKLYQDEAYRGYIASKKRSFYGLKLHLIGKPVEFCACLGEIFAVSLSQDG
ncbi:hypothetical protein KQH40_01360 [bacterium]|nr:hypothetical protein [bacterium]